MYATRHTRRASARNREVQHCVVCKVIYRGNVSGFSIIQTPKTIYRLEKNYDFFFYCLFDIFVFSAVEFSHFTIVCTTQNKYCIYKQSKLMRVAVHTKKYYFYSLNERFLCLIVTCSVYNT